MEPLQMIATCLLKNFYHLCTNLNNEVMYMLKTWLYTQRMQRHMMSRGGNGRLNVRMKLGGSVKVILIGVGIESTGENQNALLMELRFQSLSSHQKMGDRFYAANVGLPDFFEEGYWSSKDCTFTQRMIERGLLYPHTEEGKQAAILHSKVMLGIV